MKKLLIISPYFPPFNTADMQRVRQSLPYLRENGWEPTVLTVDEKYVESYSTDKLLLQTFPQDITIHKVPALKASVTRRLGIGSLSIRSFFSMRKKGDDLMKKEKFDLIYFSTTAFHVMALGPRWKRKFGVPFVLDIQDPWYNTFYYDSLVKKTFKAWGYHRLDKYLEARTVPLADGIISVSPGYRDIYIQRYPTISNDSFRVIPFGCAVQDFSIAQNNISHSSISFSPGEINAVYIGRGGKDMEFAAGIFFDALKMGMQKEADIFKKLRLWFVGTSYAQAGKGDKTFQPLAQKKGVDKQVTEVSDRLPYFETLHLLSKSDMLIVPGSTDPTYTASKIYPYIYSDKPILAVFHEQSSVCEIMSKTSQGRIVSFTIEMSEAEIQTMTQQCFDYFRAVLKKDINNANFDLKAFDEHTAQSMVKKQVNFFNHVLSNSKKE